MKQQRNLSMKGVLILTIAAIGLLQGCGESEESVATAPTSTATVTYGDIAPMIAMRCGICHIGGGTEPELGSYSHLKSNAGMVLETMEKGQMPPGGPRVPPEDLERVRAWIEGGKKQ